MLIFLARIVEPSLAMRASFGIDAFIGQAQTLHWPATDQMLIYDLRRVLRLDVTIPNSFRVNHHRGPMLALVEAA